MPPGPWYTSAPVSDTENAPARMNVKLISTPSATTAASPVNASFAGSNGCASKVVPRMKNSDPLAYCPFDTMSINRTGGCPSSEPTYTPSGTRSL